MHPHITIPPVPADTARAAKAAYSRTNFYLSVGDLLTVLLTDILPGSTSAMGTPSHLRRPSLALVTFFQYLEKLTDRQAAEATLTRIDWKYALHLSMNYPGLHPAVLCDFRQRLLCNPDQRQDFERFLERFAEKGFAAQIREQPLETMRVLNELCIRTRLDRVMASMRNALQALAIHHTEWLRTTSLPHWYSRYEAGNSKPDLTESAERQHALIEAIGADMAFLHEAITQADIPQLKALKEVQEFYQVWSEQFNPICLGGVKLYPYCYFCGTSQYSGGC